MIWRIGVAAFVCCLLGCSSTIRDRYPEETRLIDQGSYQSAASMLRDRAARGDDDAFVLLGALYYDKMGMQDQGRYMLNYAARRGNEFAQHVLFSAKLPIPAADLQQSSGGIIYCQGLASLGSSICIPVR